MFSEWSDPYDIDDYYGGLSTAFKDIASSSMYQPKPASTPSIAPPSQSGAQVVLPSGPKLPAAPEAPTGILVNNPSQKKSSFEVKPNSIFLDEHPVGSQPEYNILRSGPPSQTENFYNCTAGSSKYDGVFTYWNIVMFIIVVFLVSALIQLKMQLNNRETMLKVLSMFLAAKNGSASS